MSKKTLMLHRYFNQDPSSMKSLNVRSEQFYPGVSSLDIAELKIWGVISFYFSKRKPNSSSTPVKSSVEESCVLVVVSFLSKISAADGNVLSLDKFNEAKIYRNTRINQTPWFTTTQPYQALARKQRFSLLCRSAPTPNPNPSIPYPSRRNDEKRCEKSNDQVEKFYKIFQDMSFGNSLAEILLKTRRAWIDVYEGELTLRVGKEAITFNLDQTSRYSSNYDDNSVNRIDVIEMACEEYSQEVLGFSDVIASGNLTPYYDSIVSTSSSTLTPFGDSDFLLKEVDAFLAFEDDPTSPEVDHSYHDSEGDILLLEAFLNDDPSLPPPTQGMYLPQIRKELKICEAKNDKSSIDEPLEVELKDLPPHLEYAFLEGDDKLPVIIAKDLSVEEKATLIKALKSHKRVIAWKLSDIKGINPKFYTHKILMEDDFKPAVQHQRRVNPKIHEVIKKEVLKLLDAGLIYPISDSPWEKSHFMVNEGIVLGHKISKNGIEVDKAKVDMIAKLPHPTTIKGIQSFLGHAGFYRRFIKDFSKISRPMTRLLEKNTPFIFFDECIQAFETLKKKLTEAPILIAPDWDLPFELMCDANNFAIGAVLGQRHERHSRPIHYASKTMIEAELHYTTTEKEMLAVVYAFRFRSI
ncbi:reverse transcriptase domain-containing protein [Tanacetum coccineum]